MYRKMFSTTGAIALALALTACGGSGDNDRAREDYGFKGTSDNGVPFALNVKTGPVKDAKNDLTLTDAHGKKSKPLGSAEGCASPDNHDQVFELTFKADITNDTGTKLELNVLLGALDADGEEMNVDSSPSLNIAWLTDDRETCQKLAKGEFATMSLSEDGGYQVKGLLVLQGGADNYDGYKLTVGTDSGEVHSPKGGTRPYGAAGKTIGVVVDLVP